MRKIILHIDGGSRGNPGPSAIGVIFYNQKGQVIKKYAQFIGNTTNSEAEYRAAIFGLKKLKALFGKKLAQKMEIELRTDSDFLVKQIKGKYKVLEPNIQKLFLELWNLKIDFPMLKIKKIPRGKNKEADFLVNQVLDDLAKKQKLF